jgi:hypothetical protein
MGSTVEERRNNEGDHEDKVASTSDDSASIVSSVSSSANSVFSEEAYETEVEEVDDDSVPGIDTSGTSGKEEVKSVFVETLVDSAVLLINTIWPGECLVGGMPLRRFIQETLKRSRSSYSAFQVSLYYLICVKPRVLELRKQKKGGCDSGVLRCGRRTFLSLLILASKYLQDRNYSMGAWSKISGLTVKELAGNELQVLSAVDWNVYVPSAIYAKWTGILMRAPGEDPFKWMRLVSVLNRHLDIDRPAVMACTAAASLNSGRKRALDMQGLEIPPTKRTYVTVAE